MPEPMETDYVPDVAPIEPAPPIPTVTTPYRPPSSVPSQPRTPGPGPYLSSRRGSTSAPRPFSPGSSQPSIIRPQPPSTMPVSAPTPVVLPVPQMDPLQRRGAVTPISPRRSPSPMGRRSPLPPDNFIPYAEASPSGQSIIYLPPPHELVTTVPMAVDPYGVVPPPPVPTDDDTVPPITVAPPPPPSVPRAGPYEPRPASGMRGQVRTRDYAYGSRASSTPAVPVPPPQMVAEVPSTHSRASTHLSEYDLLRPVPEPQMHPARPRTTSGSRPPYANPPPMPVPPRTSSRGSERVVNDVCNLIKGLSFFPIAFTLTWTLS